MSAARNDMLTPDKMFRRLPYEIRQSCLRIGESAADMAVISSEAAEYFGKGQEEELRAAVIDGGKYRKIGQSMLSQYLLIKEPPYTPAEGMAILSSVNVGEETLMRIHKMEQGMFPSTAHLEVVLLMGKYQYERYDGGGPEEISGEKLPFLAQLGNIADQFDGLVMAKNIDKRINCDEAKEEIIKESGKRYSREAVDCFLRAYDRIKKLY